MATNKQVLDNLRTAIVQRVQMCNNRTMPKVCKLSSTPEGMNEIVTYVTNLVVKADLSIIEGITEMERMLNPNRIKD